MTRSDLREYGPKNGATGKLGPPPSSLPTISAEGFLFMEEAPSVSQLLIAWGRGEPAALEQLNPRVYGELHKLARAYLRRGSSGQRVKTTKPNSVCYAKSPDG